MKDVKIEELTFLTGTWSAEVWGGTWSETWSAPTGGLMLGHGSHLVSGKVGIVEYMSIEPGDKGLVMYMVLGKPSKGAPKVSPFGLKSFDGKTAVFENPTNDFPKTISYTKSSSNKLLCILEGMQRGKASKETFNFTKRP
jgi:hypothetical protein